MAEHSFQEVMKQYNRMFEAHKKGVSIPVEASYETAVKQPDFFEKCVMEWAAANPEPVYPTWGEWLISVGAARKIPTDIPFELPDGRIVDSPWETVVDIDAPIPASTAEKLGIEPKEG